MKVYKALSIAGSHSRGGAGIQADLKTFQERDVYGMGVITLFATADYKGNRNVFPQPLQVIEAQWDTVFSGMDVDALKTGMLFSVDIMRLVTSKIKTSKVPHVVVDPVMASKEGAALSQEDSLDVLKKELIPLGSVVTPNLPEAALLAGMDSIRTVAEMKEAAKRIHDLGSRYVLVKGGRLTQENAIDLLYDGVAFQSYEAERIDTPHTNGAGCTLSAAITAELAKGKPIAEAVGKGKAFITEAIRHAVPVGRGRNPTYHAAYRKYVKS
ncbi:bifunctional hydroxymethylpyrimidine kinase/phosphomethylpyrimidine kinase [Kroppenstedtia pulmonis]|uniref:pyridoxal kinase n=1 Tax=Kroppenstedtia pulmonis TaxID=1380685 RepID=A0A7D3Y7Z9_9BACL|nr:bifunctional hydroxymethylpyrimidine kinase/phosphomethylpyrimidine kinase [Kroppenstedtia pulmonis]QKG83201.1 bifunctional hydroxymethylpyrimidine kinase/phosphomethylpyrimidine kinase [Kroppenstedtia pulmonis]